MSLGRTKERASIKGKGKTKEIKLKTAIVLPAELGDKLLNTLLELPIKYQPILGSLIDGLHKAYRVNDMTIHVSETPTPKPKTEKDA